MGEKPMRNKEQAILEAAEREFIAKGFAGGADDLDRRSSRCDARHAALLFPDEGTTVRTYPRREDAVDGRIGAGSLRAAGIAAGGAAAPRNRAAFRFHHGQ